MEDEIDFKEYLFIMKKNWGLIIIIFLLILGGTVFYTFTTTPTYETESRVILMGQDQSSYVLRNTRTTNIDIETEAAIMQSSVILGLVEERVFGEFEIDIAPIKDSNIITIIASSNDRVIAQKAANAVADTYVNYTISSKRDAALELNMFITEQLINYNQELDALNKMILKFDPTQELTIDEQLEFNKINQDIKAKQELYNYLLSRKEEVGILSHEKGMSVKVLEYAQIPLIPTKPNIPLNLLLGLFLGLAGGMGAAILKENIRDRLTTQKDIESYFGSIIIGNIPQIENYKIKVKLVKKKHKNLPKHKLKIVSKQGNKYLVQHHKPQMKFAEQMRKLRTNIIFYLKDNNIKLISVTSPGDKEGKTTIACNLALSMAQNDKKVLLVDANLRDPQIQNAFDIKSEGSNQGLTDVLLEDIPVEKVIIKSKSLSLLLSGRKHDFPSELLSSHAMNLLCKKLKSMKYDVIIIDNTSMDFSETAFMGANSDGVLMVIGHDKTRRDMTENAIATLEKAKAKIIGVVINNSK